jgi:hypothetical protein
MLCRRRSPLGAALAERLFELAWIEPAPPGRAVLITDAWRGRLEAAVRGRLW